MKRLSFCRWVGLLLVVALLRPALAQQLPATRYTTREGLAQMQCLAVLTDSRGYVWVGTKNGLSKFDGEHFENFSRADGLLTNFIDGLAEDKTGNIWISNVNGLVRFDGKTFTAFPFPDSLRWSKLRAIDGKTPLIWHNGSPAQLLRLDGDRYTPLLTTRGKNSAFLHHDPRTGTVYYTEEQKDPAKSAIYAYRNGKSTRWRGYGGAYQNLNPFGKLADGTPTFMYSNARATNEQTYLYFTPAGLVPFFQTDGKTYRVLKTPPAQAVVVHASQAYLLQTSAADLTELPIPAPNYATVVFEGKSIWCGTEKGLYRIWNNGFRYFTEEQVPYCWSVVEDRQQQMWFLNYGHPLLRYDGQRISHVTGYETARSRQNPLTDTWYYHPIRDKYGAIWLTNSAGAVRYDGTRFTLHNNDQPPGSTLCLLEDPARNLVLQGGENWVKFIENKPPYRATYFDQAAGFTDPNQLVLSMLKDAQGDYWFGGYALTRYNYERKTVSYYTPENGKLPAKGIQSMTLDARQNIWAASGRGGLLLFDRARDRFRRVLPDTSMSAMLVGNYDRDHLLFGDWQNLYVMDLARFYRTGQAQYKVFNHNNGFMGVEPGQDGFYKDSRGHIWITSSTVLSRLDPRQIDLRPAPLRVVVSRVNNERVAFCGDPVVVGLTSGQNVASFTVEALGKDKPFSTQYRYRVAGFLDGWSAWQTQNLLTLTNLAGGTHTLQVQARSGNLTNDAPAENSLRFRVQLPFWRSPDFYKFALLIGLALLAGVLYLGQRQRKNRERVLAQQQQLDEQHERERQQQQKLDDQDQKVKFLQVQTIQAQMNPHFTFNVLGTIQNLILTNDTERANNSLVKLSHLIRSFLEASLLGDEQADGSLFAHEIPLAREIDLLRMYIEFEQLQYEGRITYEISIDGKINPENYRVPPLILQPFVENAIKHGILYKDEPAGHVVIRFVSLTDDELVCTIEDDGVGRKQAGEIQQQSLKKYKSRGTELVKRRVDLLNQMGYTIHIQTDDRLGGGTVVTVKFGYQ